MVRVTDLERCAMKSFGAHRGAVRAVAATSK
ncbi:hypothetical protein HaLaN_22119, partial [Haematococcus lacustris]